MVVLCSLNQQLSWAAATLHRVNKQMEDIEDLLVGSGAGGAPPGFRLPINAVGVNPKCNKKKPRLHNNHLSKTDSPSPKIPGTEVLSHFFFGSLFIFLFCFKFCLFSNF